MPPVPPVPPPPPPVPPVPPVPPPSPPVPPVPPVPPSSRPQSVELSQGSGSALFSSDNIGVHFVSPSARHHSCEPGTYPH
ncbi:hypothetical protein DNM94_24940 [Salmonella enterica subsp. enterica serovar Potsdam]|nr:hypothetical protein [Salmonella enterica subsp. enterica serovar Potsdam]